MQSSSAQTMQSQTPKGAPAGTEREVLDLISIRGEVSVQAELLDHDAGGGTSAANVSMLPRAFPSQRGARIRRRNKCTCDEMFSELMQASRSWRQTVAEFRKAENERQERRQERQERRWEREERRWQRQRRIRDAILRLMQEQTDLLRRLVELQERQQEHRAPLQSLYNHPRAELQ
nr:trichohyalin-like [Chelonoidis abingdonii]